MATIGVLGTVGVSDDAGAAVRLGGVKPRAILAYLAMHAGRDVAVTTLIDAVWGEDAPETAVNTLQVNVSSLRRALAPCGVPIERTTGAYRLGVPPTAVDAHRFEGLIAEGRAAVRGHRPERGLELLTAGLAMWHGRPFDGLEMVPFVGTIRPALERVRSSASTERIECLLQLGRFDEAAADAEQVVAGEPFDERAWALAMTGYYWAGRQSDALHAFQRAREVLAEELGLEPGPELVALERGVLDHTLPSPRHRTAAVDRDAGRRSSLPGERPLVGRDRLVDQVARALDSDERLVSLIGLGGIGKTSVAIAVAHRFAGEGCDVWFADVSAATDAAAAAGIVLRSVGAESSAEPITSLESWVEAADGVLVIDNLEQVTDAGRLITSLRRASTRLRLLVTSRRAVRVRGEQVVPVPPLPLEPRLVPEDGAGALFARRAAQVRADLADLDPGIANQICELTAGIPLAIELAALQLRVLSPEQLLGRLSGFVTSALDFGATDDYPDRQRSLRAVLDATTSMLSENAASVLLRCVVVAGPLSTDLVELVCRGRGIDGLAGLADLIESGLAARLDGGDAVSIPVPVRQHVLETSDRASRIDAEDDLVAATRRLLEDADGGWHGPSSDHHRTRLSLDAAAIDSSVALLTERRDWAQLAELSFLLAQYWLQQSRFNEALSTLDVLALGDLPGDVALRSRLLRGTFASYVNRSDTAELLESALADLPVSTRPDRLVVNAWCCLGACHAHHHRNDDLRRCATEATDAAAASGDPTLVSLARDFAAFAANYLGDTEAAIDLSLAAITDARRRGDHHALALLLVGTAEPLLEVDRVDEAKALTDEAFELARDLELGVATGAVLLMTGATEVALGRPLTAWGSLIEHLRFVTDRHPNPMIQGDSLSLLGAVLSLLGEEATAARTWGAANAKHADQGIDPDRRRLQVVRRHWDATRERFGATRFDALVLAGSTAPDRVVTELLERASGPAS